MTEKNGVMLQAFHWYTQGDGWLWNWLQKEATSLAEAGFTAIWLPPAYKGAGGGFDVGYGVYDLFDLGEFEQKGTVATKYGSKEDYIKGIKKAQKAGMEVYGDIVLNHRLGADHAEEFYGVPINPENRREAIGKKHKIRAWTHFSFPGRKGEYSELNWHWWHFNAVDYSALDEERDAIYLIEGKTFDDDVAKEKGNYDYLMGCNLDLNSPDVEKELIHWGKWYLDTTGIDGFRFDAVKHVKSKFFLKWLHTMRKHKNRNLFAVGEYWSKDLRELCDFIDDTQENIMLFDVNLHYNFVKVSKDPENFDIRKIFQHTLMKNASHLAATFVSNHDSQPLQSLESVVEPWFVPLAYGIILLRREGYPTVFIADYHGAKYKDQGHDGKEYEIELVSHQWMINKFLYARKNYAYGDQDNYSDQKNLLAWTRKGSRDNSGGLAVLISTGENRKLSMKMPLGNKVYKDLTEHIDKRVKTDEMGWGVFSVKKKSISVWVLDS
ncbi:alpha-amylase [Isachenkonia alkalipeptolytica]|uniref:Alpha-amylase n=1 Tax=Isachenkonia alkalipeptolytica TaxID=2565777 RepID=A0AA44BFF2_9CLOT|nr:alpha-amylase [Isachenkonia alkalipeptolytica]NBG88481.1 alpha-amylase [Isachenkonia alkalipeptolytica]